MEPIRGPAAWGVARLKRGFEHQERRRGCISLAAFTLRTACHRMRTFVSTVVGPGTALLGSFGQGARI
jgi:hypothetical protein